MNWCLRNSHQFSVDTIQMANSLLHRLPVDPSNHHCLLFSGCSRDVGTSLTKMVIRHRSIDAKFRGLTGWGGGSVWCQWGLVFRHSHCKVCVILVLQPSNRRGRVFYKIAQPPPSTQYFCKTCPLYWGNLHSKSNQPLPFLSPRLQGKKEALSR